MTLQIDDRTSVIKGTLLVQLSDGLFWFDRPSKFGSVSSSLNSIHGNIHTYDSSLKGKLNKRTCNTQWFCNTELTNMFIIFSECIWASLLHLGFSIQLFIFHYNNQSLNVLFMPKYDHWQVLKKRTPTPLNFGEMVTKTPRFSIKEIKTHFWL